MAQSDEEKWLQYAEEYGSPLEDQNKVVVVEEDDIDETMSIPGLQYNIDPTTSTRATPLRYVQLHLSSLFAKIAAMLQTVTNAVSDLAQIKAETNAAKDAANQAAENVQDAIDDAEVATDGAERVNATLVGATVTITNRNGQSTSVNIGFEIAPENVYTSKQAMIVDAANVPAGKFCMIATTSPTDPDNATLWSRNSQPASAGEGAFTFLSDLDQAATHVWDDWNTNLRQQVVTATNDANTAASNANAKAVLANTAASNADTSRQAIEQNESTRQSNESTRQQNETTRGQNEQSRVNAETLREQQATNDHQQYLSDTQLAGQDHNRAVQDHNTADADHTLAGQDHETASDDHDTALQDHQNTTDAIEASETQTDIAEEYNQHPPYIGNDNYWYLYNTTTHAYVRAAYAKGNDLDYSTMTPEEVQMLIDNIKADLIVASIETCESIIDELT